MSLNNFIQLFLYTVSVQWVDWLFQGVSWAILPNLFDLLHDLVLFNHFFFGRV